MQRRWIDTTLAARSPEDAAAARAPSCKRGQHLLLVSTCTCHDHERVRTRAARLQPLSSRLSGLRPPEIGVASFFNRKSGADCIPHEAGARRPPTANLHNIGRSPPTSYFPKPPQPPTSSYISPHVAAACASSERHAVKVGVRGGYGAPKAAAAGMWRRELRRGLARG